MNNGSINTSPSFWFIQSICLFLPSGESLSSLVPYFIKYFSTSKCPRLLAHIAGVKPVGPV